MTAQLIPALVYRDFTNGGQPLAFGLVYTYAAGTTTPQATYVDSTQTTQQTNPVLLNARGEASIWLNPSLSYKFVVTDSNGNTIRTVDNVNGGDQVGGSLVPTTTNLYNLGSPSLTWANGYFGTAVYVSGVPVVSYPQTAAETAATVTPTVYTYPPGNVLRYGAKGDGTTDDTAAINAAGSINYPVLIPYTSGNGYKITSTVTFNQDVTCQGQLYAVGVISNTGESSGSWTASNPAVLIQNSALSGNSGSRLKVRGLFVEGDTNAKTNNTIAIRVIGNGHILEDCGGAQCGFGLVLSGFIIQITNCTFGACNSNLVMYAPSQSYAINSIIVSGGNYGNGTNYALNIGDVRFSTTISLGNPQGVSIRLEGFNCDQAPVMIDNVASVCATNIYFEYTVTGTAGFILGGSGTNYLNDVDIGTCFFNNITYAIQCQDSIGSLKIRACFYNAVTVAVQYFDCQNQGAYYEAGSSAGSFVNPSQVTYAFPGQTISTLSFAGVTNTAEGLYNGIQYSYATITKWFPGAAQITNNSGTIGRTINNSALAGIYYTTPHTAQAASVVNGQATVQMTTISHSYYFNGGDAIAISTVSGGANAGAAVVVSVNYVTGVLTVDANATGTGTVTIAQLTVTTKAVA